MNRIQIEKLCRQFFKIHHKRNLNHKFNCFYQEHAEFATDEQERVILPIVRLRYRFVTKKLKKYQEYADANTADQTDLRRMMLALSTALSPFLDLLTENDVPYEFGVTASYLSDRRKEIFAGFYIDISITS